MKDGPDDYLVVPFNPAGERRFDRFLIRTARLIRGGRAKVIIHFKGEMEFNPNDLRILHRFLKSARLRLADVRMVVPSVKMRETLQLTRLDIFTRIYDTLEAAKRERGFMPFIKYGSIAAAVILVLFYSRPVQWLFFSWGIDPYYSHGFLVAAVGLFFLWRRREKLVNPKSVFAPASFSLLGLSGLLYLLGISGGANFILGFSLVAFLLGAVLLLYGQEIYQQTFLPIILLVFAIPLPRLDEAASFLQHHTAAWTARLVSMAGIEAYSVGVNLFFGDSHIVIDAPCSGLRSLIALLFVGTLFVSLLQTSLAKKALLLASILPVSILANLARITVLVLIADGWGLKAAMVYFHYLSGILLFVIALSVLFLERGLLRCGWETV